jgi:hypothetical protein
MQLQPVYRNGVESAAESNNDKLLRPLMYFVRAHISRRESFLRAPAACGETSSVGAARGATHVVPEVSWRTNSSGGGSAAVSNCPGSTIGAPYTSSAAEMPESSLGAALRPNRTHGIRLVQSAAAARF